MPRKRMIDPAIWTDTSFGELSVMGRLVYIGMFSMADDEGRGEASAKFLKGTLFPYDDGLRVADVNKTLREIGSKMSVDFYTHSGKEYYSFINWKKWQKVEKPGHSKIPPPPQKVGKGEGIEIPRPFPERSPTIPRTFPDHSPPNMNMNMNINLERDSAHAREYTIDDILKICEVECPAIYKRHRDKPLGDYKLGQILEEIQEIMTLEDIRNLFKQAAKKYPSQPNYKSCDLIWVLNNKAKIKAADEITESVQSKKTKQEPPQPKYQTDADGRKFDCFGNEVC